MTTISNSQRTHIAADEHAVRLQVAGATRDVYVLLDDDRAPRVLVTGADEEAHLFDLSNVTTGTHGWLDDDGLDETDPDVQVDPGANLDTVLIRGVVEHMVAIDYAAHAEESPRLLFWTDHAHDDEAPRVFPL